MFYGIWKYSPISISRSSHERGKEKGPRLPTAGRLFARLMAERARVCRHRDLNSEHQTGNVFGRFSVTRLAFVMATKKMRHPVPHPQHPGEPTAGQRGRGESGSLRRGGAWHGGSLNTVFRRSRDSSSEGRTERRGRCRTLPGQWREDPVFCRRAPGVGRRQACHPGSAEGLGFPLWSWEPVEP